MTPTLQERYRGALLGLACGDAVGTSVEFRARGTFPPVTDMAGGGPFGLQAGQWTDDTSMALCLATSLLEKKGFDAADQMQRYTRWWREGYLSATGECFDIGITVRKALAAYEASGEPFSGSTDPYTAGNGSLMRLAPVVLYFHPDVQDVLHFCAESSRTTHAAPEAIQCCELLGLILTRVLAGDSRASLRHLQGYSFSEPRVADIASGTYVQKTCADITGSGYSVSSLEAAFWCFYRTSSFEEAILKAANLGDDADTTAAITGQLCGAYYGVRSIPPHWLEKLHMRAEIETMADALLEAAIAR